MFKNFKEDKQSNIRFSELEYDINILKWWYKLMTLNNETRIHHEQFLKYSKYQMHI